MIVRRIALAALSAGLLAGYTTIAAEPAPSVSAGLNSKKDNGVVSLLADSELSDGRLVLKIVAFNRTDHPAEFGANAIDIHTAAGKPVALVSLDRLVEEARSAAAPPAHSAAMEHDPANYSHMAMRHDGVGGSGEPDVSGYTGASNPTNGVLPAHTQATNSATPEKYDPELQAQIANLNAAILHPLVIAPSKAEGGQVVTEKLKFSRKEERALHLVVSFNGEQHEFDFAVPAAR